MERERERDHWRMDRSRSGGETERRVGHVGRWVERGK